MAKNPKTTTPPPKTGQSGFKISFSINNNKKTNSLSNNNNFSNKNNNNTISIKTENENTESKNDEDEDEDEDDDVIKKLASAKIKKNKLGFKSFYKVPSVTSSVKQEVTNEGGAIKDENNNNEGTQGVLGDWQSLTPKKGWKPVKTTVEIFGGSDNQKTRNTCNDNSNNNNNNTGTDNHNNLRKSEDIEHHNADEVENNNSNSDRNNDYKDGGSSDWKIWLEGPMESDDSGSERGLLFIFYQVPGTFGNFVPILSYNSI